MDASLKSIACALAEATPDHAGKKAFPPQAWWQEGDQIAILCADGRKIRGPIAQAAKVPAKTDKPLPTVPAPHSGKTAK